jgi:hypothetical protein
MHTPTRSKKVFLNRDRKGAFPQMEKGADVVVRPSPRRSESTLEL